MSSCCLSGALHEGKPQGREDTIGGLQTYISEPTTGSKKKSIIFITDGTSKLIPLAPHYQLTNPQSSDGSSPTSGCSQTSTPKPGSIPTFPISSKAVLFRLISCRTSSPRSRTRKPWALREKLKTPPSLRQRWAHGFPSIAKASAGRSSTASSIRSA